MFRGICAAIASMFVSCFFVQAQTSPSPQAQSQTQTHFQTAPGVTPANVTAHVNERQKAQKRYLICQNQNVPHCKDVGVVGGASLATTSGYKLGQWHLEAKSGKLTEAEVRDFLGHNPVLVGMTPAKSERYAPMVKEFMEQKWVLPAARLMMIGGTLVLAYEAVTPSKTTSTEVDTDLKQASTHPVQSK